MVTMLWAVDRWLHRTPHGDQMAMLVFFSGGLFLLWYELSYIAAFNHRDWSGGYLIHAFIILFLAVNIYGNWSLVFLKESTWTGGMMHWGSGWKLCLDCAVCRPPRSHHCVLCRACVLRHDHHCWFAGACIGLVNQRHFFAMSLHMLLAGVYCNLYNWRFLRSVLKEVNLTTLLSLLVPHFTVLMGQEGWFTFWFNSVTTVGFALVAVFAWLFYRQAMQLIHGQTSFERQKGVRDYDRGWRGNVEEVLGQHGLWVLLWPWLASPGLPQGHASSQQCWKLL